MANKLNLQRIFSSPDFADEGFDHPRFVDDNKYTTLRKKTRSFGNEKADLTSTTSADNSMISTDTHELMLHDPAYGTEICLVSEDQLIPSGHTNPLSIDAYSFSKDKSKILIFTKSQKVWRFKTKGEYWVYDLLASNGPSLKQLGASFENPNELMFASLSPDSTRVAYVYHHNIFVENILSNSIIQVTIDGSATIINGTFDWVYEEEFHLYSGFRWSPDGQHIAFWQIDQSPVSVVNLVNNTDTLYPSLVPIPYPKCGTANPIARLGVVGVVESGGSQVKWIDFDGDAAEHYIVDMNYLESTGEIVVQRLNRLQNDLSIHLVSPEGCIRVVHCEKDPAWIDVTKNLRWIRDASAFLHLSEINGWKQLFLISKEGTSIALTPPEFDVEAVSGYDSRGGVVYFTASPHDPLRLYLYAVSVDAPLVTKRITPDRDFMGTSRYTLCEDCSFAVHAFSSCNTPTTTTIISLPSHATVKVLATNSNLLQMFQQIDCPPIEFFRVPIPDEGGAFTAEESLLDAWCIYPPGFDSTKVAAYPLVVHVYGEPAAQIVRDQWGGRMGLWHRMLAQQGAVVVCVDNRGVPALRGRNWRKCIYRQVGVTSPRDQAHALRHVLASRPYLDRTRVAVWGWSGGGTMSLNSLFRYPDLYSSAISVAPVPDMRLYDSIYQERYMGLPADNAEGYRDGSPITYASQMKDTQNLLVIHGTGDDNCHYQGTERLINELVLHNKPFQMLAYPNRSHSISEGRNTSRHLFEQMTRFLVSVGVISKE